MSDTNAPPLQPGAPLQEDRTTKRLLYFLVGLLLIAALALLVVLFSILRPEPGTGTSAAEGYPVIPVRSLLAWGGDIGDSLSKPLSASFDAEGNVWVSDTGNKRVLVYAEDGSSLRMIGDQPGPGKLVAPYGVAVDGVDDKVYVADYGAGRVQVYTTEGAYITSIPNAKTKLKRFGPDGFFPYDVKVLNDRIVASNNNGLYFFSKAGDIVNIWGTTERGGGYTQFNFPNAFTADCTNDLIYVADTTNRRVVALDPNGNVQWISGTPDASGQLTGFWQLPKGITMGPEGNMYVVDTFRTVDEGVGDGYFVVLDPQGNLVSAFGRTGDEEDSFSFPEHIDFNGRDLWAVADREHNRVLLFNLAPIPEPDLPNLEKYPPSFDAGPFPENVTRPTEGASPMPQTLSCVTPVAAAQGGIPWWVWALLAIALILIIVAIRRLLQNRKERQAAALATSSAAVGDGSSGPASPDLAAETPDEAPSVPEETPPDGS